MTWMVGGWAELGPLGVPVGCGHISLAASETYSQAELYKQTV